MTGEELTGKAEFSLVESQETSMNKLIYKVEINHYAWVSPYLTISDLKGDKILLMDSVIESLKTMLLAIEIERNKL